MKTRPFNLEDAKGGAVCVNSEGFSGEYKFSINKKDEGIFHFFHMIGNDTEYCLFVNDSGQAYSSMNQRMEEHDLSIRLNEVDYWVASADHNMIGVVWSCPAISEEDSVSSLNSKYSTLDNIQTQKITRYE